MELSFWVIQKLKSAEIELWQPMPLCFAFRVLISIAETTAHSGKPQLGKLKS